MVSRLASAIVNPVAVVSSVNNSSQITNWSVYYETLHLQQSSLPMPLPQRSWHPRRDDEIIRDADTDLYTGTDLSHIPRVAADFMFNNYVDVHLSQYPCLNEQRLTENFKRCFPVEHPEWDSSLRPPPQPPSPYDLFTVCMALAVSSNTFMWKNEKNAVSASAWFFKRAKDQLLQHPTAVGANCIQQIEVALLLTLYSFGNPTACDPWYCIGDAVRLCVHLGLHQELGSLDSVEPLELDTRRRLFWTTCGLERTVCSHLRLPYTLKGFPNMTKFPSPLSDACIARGGMVEDSGAPIDNKKSPALHILQFRLLESEIYDVLWLQEKTTTSSGSPDAQPLLLEDWIMDMSTRLDNWYSTAIEFAAYQQPDYGPEQKLEISTLMTNYLRFRLTRPCPRIRHRSPRCRLVCFKAAMDVVDEYSRYYRRERLFYPWFAGHLLFETSVVLLDAVWSTRGSDSYWLHEYAVDLHQVLLCIRGLPALLRQVARFWPAVTSCADRVAELSAPVITYLDEALLQSHPPGPTTLDAQQQDTTSRLLAEHLFPDSVMNDGPGGAFSSLVAQRHSPAAQTDYALTAAVHQSGNDDDNIGYQIFDEIDWSTVQWPESLFPDEALN